MKKHVVEISDLESYSFEHEFCASYGGQTNKSLKIYVHPSSNHMHFKLYVNREHVLTCYSFDKALEAYNEV